MGAHLLGRVLLDKVWVNILVRDWAHLKRVRSGRVLAIFRVREEVSENGGSADNVVEHELSGRFQFLLRVTRVVNEVGVLYITKETRESVESTVRKERDKVILTQSPRSRALRASQAAAAAMREGGVDMNR